MKKNKALVLLACVVFVLVLIVGISTSYSVKTEDVKPKSTVNNEEEKLSVELENLSTGQVVEGTEILNELTSEGTTLKDGAIVVHNPGDYVSYTFDIVNKGNVNTELALLEIPVLSCTSADGNMEIAERVCNQIGVDMSYNYEPNKSVEIGDSLAKGTATSFTVSIIYNNGPEALENVNVQVNGIKIALNYQKNSSAKVTVGQKN